MNLPKKEDILDFSHTVAAPLFENTNQIFEVLPKIKNFISELGASLPKDEFSELADEVFVAKDANISKNATIEGPAIIGHKAEIRPGAYIRGSVIIGNGAVIGNSTEVKNAIIFDLAQLPHYNYVGDSVLGYKSHLGAGAVISNFKLDHTDVKVRQGDETLETGLRKFGAIIGDYTEIGCGSVIFPGTIIGRNTMVYPLTPVRGVIQENSIVRSENTLNIIPKK